MATIILPKSAITEINKEYVKVEIPDKNFSFLDKTTKWEKLENARGILKDYNIDPLKYQLQCRDEWVNRI